MGMASGRAERLCVGEEGEREDEDEDGVEENKARSNPFNNPRTGEDTAIQHSNRRHDYCSGERGKPG